MPRKAATTKTIKVKIEVSRDRLDESVSDVRANAIAHANNLFTYDRQNFCHWTRSFGITFLDKEFWKNIHALTIGTDWFDKSIIRGMVISDAFFEVYDQSDVVKQIHTMIKLCDGHQDAYAPTGENSTRVRSRLANLESQAKKAFDEISETPFPTVTLSVDDQRVLYKAFLRYSEHKDMTCAKITNGFYAKVFPKAPIRESLNSAIMADLTDTNSRAYGWKAINVNKMMDWLEPATIQKLRDAYVKDLNKGYWKEFRNFLMHSNTVVSSEDRVLFTKAILLHEHPGRVSEIFRDTPEVFDAELLKSELIKKIEDSMPSSPQKMVENLLSGKPERTPYPMHPLMMFGPFYGPY